MIFWIVFQSFWNYLHFLFLFNFCSNLSFIGSFFTLRHKRKGARRARAVLVINYFHVVSASRRDFPKKCVRDRTSWNKVQTVPATTPTSFNPAYGKIAPISEEKVPKRMSEKGDARGTVKLRWPPMGCGLPAGLVNPATTPNPLRKLTKNRRGKNM